MKPEPVVINTGFIKLDSFLKFCGATATGGAAKEVILGGKISVNGEVCLMRGKKLKTGDIVYFEEKVYEIKDEKSSSQ